MAPPETLELARQITARVGRLQCMIAQLPRADVTVSSNHRDVVVAVDTNGQLIALQLAHGVTQRFTRGALEALINSTLRTAVATAAARR